MMETEARHKEYFVEFEKKLREIYPDMLAIGAGCCTKCKVCTYPDAPCRFPKQAFSSMEAYGMLVTQVCQANVEVLLWRLYDCLYELLFIRVDSISVYIREFSFFIKCVDDCWMY